MIEISKKKTQRHPLYMTWACMKDRCTNPKHKNFKTYGGNGVSVCDRWLTFSNFVEDMGEKPSKKHSLDRIDSSGNYEPSNCRWADPVTQGQNTSRVKKIEIDGVIKCLAEWCRMHNIKKATVQSRIKAGLSIEEALSKTVRLDGRSSAWKNAHRG